jgi:hypothetical protein
MRLMTRLAVICVLTMMATGCARIRSNVTGTITRDGKPLEWPKAERKLYVLFMPVDVSSGRDPVQAVTDVETGTFRVPEIRSGTYLVAIQMFDEHYTDVLQHKYNPASSPLRVEVTEDNQVVDIDLPKDLP